MQCEVDQSKLRMTSNDFSDYINLNKKAQRERQPYIRNRPIFLGSLLYQDHEFQVDFPILNSYIW